MRVGQSLNSERDEKRTSPNASKPSITAYPRSQASRRASAACLPAGDDLDDLLSGRLDRRAEQRDNRRRGGGKADGEHDPVHKAVAALLAANSLRCVEEPDTRVC